MADSAEELLLIQRCCHFHFSIWLDAHYCYHNLFSPSFGLAGDSIQSGSIYNKYASCPDWRISPHADRRHRQQWPVCHTGLMTARAVCCTWLTSVQCIIDFSLFGLGGLTPGSNFTKRGIPGILLDLPSCKISLPYVNPRPRTVTKNPTDKQNDKQ